MSNLRLSLLTSHIWSMETGSMYVDPWWIGITSVHGSSQSSSGLGSCHATDVCIVRISRLKTEALNSERGLGYYFIKWPDEKTCREATRADRLSDWARFTLSRQQPRVPVQRLSPRILIRFQNFLPGYGRELL